MLCQTAWNLQSPSTPGGRGRLERTVIRNTPSPAFIGDAIYMFVYAPLSSQKLAALFQINDLSSGRNYPQKWRQYGFINSIFHNVIEFSSSGSLEPFLFPALPFIL
jgi:hypothetical protein